MLRPSCRRIGWIGWLAWLGLDLGSDEVCGYDFRGRRSVAKHGLLVVTYPSSRNRRVANEKLFEWFCFIGTRSKPQHRVSFCEFRVGKGESPETFVQPGKGYGSVYYAKRWVAREKGSGVSVGAQAEVNKIKTARGEFAQRLLVEVRSGIGGHLLVDGHSVHVARGNINQFDQAFAELRKVAISTAFGGQSLVNLEEVDRSPVKFVVGEGPKHGRGSGASGNCEGGRTSLGNGGFQIAADPSRSACCRIRCVVAHDYLLEATREREIGTDSGTV